VVAQVEGHPASAVTHALSGAGTIRFPIDRKWLQQDAAGHFLLPLQLHFPDAARPAQLGVNGDQRMLGFAPSSVSLVEPAR